MSGAITADRGEHLYDAFWARNGWADPTPFAKQAPAIISMWNNIADDAARLTPAPDALDRDAVIGKLTEALNILEKAATSVAKYGAQSGPQWPPLNYALLIARTALKSSNGQ